MKMYNEKNHSDLIKLKAYNKFIVKSLPRIKCTPFGKSSKVKIWVQYDLFKLLIWLKKKNGKATIQFTLGISFKKHFNFRKMTESLNM